MFQGFSCDTWALVTYCPFVGFTSLTVTGVRNFWIWNGPFHRGEILAAIFFPVWLIGWLRTDQISHLKWLWFPTLIILNSTPLMALAQLAPNLMPHPTQFTWGHPARQKFLNSPLIGKRGPCSKWKHNLKWRTVRGLVHSGVKRHL